MWNVCDKHQSLYCRPADLKPKDAVVGAKGLSLSCNRLISMVECIFAGELHGDIHIICDHIVHYCNLHTENCFGS